MMPKKIKISLFFSTLLMIGGLFFAANNAKAIIGCGTFPCDTKGPAICTSPRTDTCGVACQAEVSSVCRSDCNYIARPTGYGCTYGGDRSIAELVCGGIVEETIIINGSCTPPPICSNGIIETGEACDDKNFINNDGCSSSCAVEAGWLCDTNNPSSCNTICGDGILVPGYEQCDDGNLASFDGCSKTCQLECGNGILEGSEQCDDGNRTTEPCVYGLKSCTVCDSSCNLVPGQTSYCGDNILKLPIELCDSPPFSCTATGNYSGTRSCLLNCSDYGPCVASEFCGDGIINGLEVCDDGNTSSGDGCSTACLVESGWDCDSGACVGICGDGMVVGSETCDDGGLNGTANNCNSTCTGNTNPICGNNVLEAGEQCDDGNAITEQCSYGQTSCTVCGSTCQNTPGATSFCGDGIINGSEICDDGANNGQPLYCNSTCTNTTAPVCGNNVLEAGEQCDDGNTTIEACAYGVSFCTVCGSTCQNTPGTTSFCGDGSVDAVNGEACDDNNIITENCAYGLTSCTVCGSTCQNTPGTTSFCGDSIINGSEICDDGANNGQPTYCNSTCTGTTAAVCGNNVLETGEQCDNGILNSNTVPNACRTNCTNPICGDNTIDTGEICDNNSQICTDSSGYPGIANCSSGCGGFDPCVSGLFCGDSILNNPPEICDDGDTSSGNGCSNTCQIENGWRCSGSGPGSCLYVCGDGVINAGETCDDGGLNGTANNCNSTCTGTTAPICGNGIIESGETCDDGNNDTDDGCSDLCSVEQYYSCTTGNPSICAPRCGDNYLVGTEECDDGNRFDQDGCSPSCQIEIGWKCTNTLASTPISSCFIACSDNICDPTENCSTCSSDCGICSVYNPPPAKEHEAGIFGGVFDEVKLILSKPQARIKLPGFDFGEAELKTPSPDVQTNVYQLNTATRIILNNTDHTITVNEATNESISLILRSEPTAINNLGRGESRDVDSDGDGFVDTRFTYEGLEGGRPKLTVKKITPTSPDEDSSQYIDSPFISQYIADIYRYLVIIGSVVAVVIIILAGIQWTASGGNPERITSAKNRLVGAITGLLLILGSYTILFTINPNLVKFRNLRILYIKGEELFVEEENSNVEYDGSIPSNITRPTWDHASFSCEKSQEAGVAKRSTLKNIICDKGVHGTVITTEAMGEAICDVGEKLYNDGYGIAITSSYRPFSTQVDYWCNQGAQNYPNTDERKRYYAVPGYSNHGHGVAIDAHLTNRQGVRLYNLGSNPSREQCNTAKKDDYEKYAKILAEAFYETDDKFNRLESEMWHFEYDTGRKTSVGKHIGLPAKCN